MKLRLKDDSLRLRLAQSEVTELAAGRPVEGRTRFSAEAALAVKLGPSATLDSPHASFDSSTIRVQVPRADLMAWASSAEVSLRGVQALPDGELTLLIEKDFQCLAPRPDEDESDLFPHPEADGHDNCDAD